MSKEIDWNNLGFSYMSTDSHICYVWRDGEWGRGELVSDPYMNLHIASTALHYGQSAFEGLKAFKCKNGDVRLFRPFENARRMNRTARRVCMPEVSEEMFLEAIKRVIRANQDYVPPYGTGGSLYVRPILLGSGPQIGVRPAEEYVFMVLVVPVGPYYKGGLEPVRAVVLDDYDRAAPKGVGNVKVAGNYAISLEPHNVARNLGYSVELFLDAATHTYIDEFSTSNFIGITQDGRYVTPDSSSILPSITNDTLQQLAQDMGMPVERRPIRFEEIENFAEVGACGTAVVITPVNEIARGEKVFKIGPQQGCGSVLQSLYESVNAIQYGEEEDPHGWTVPVEM